MSAEIAARAVTSAGRSPTNDGKLHEPSDIGASGAYAARTGHHAFRTTPLRGFWQHPPNLHDGSAGTLAGVVTRYNKVRSLNLIEFLKSL